MKEEEKSFMFTENQLDLISEIISDFDFEKVQKVMEFLGWTWATSNGIPDVSDIRRSATSLLKAAIKSGVKEEDNMTVSSGGLEAKYYYGKEEGLTLKFVLEDAGTI